MKENIKLPISGPQHIKIPEVIYEGYRALHAALKEEFGAKKLSAYFPIVGSRYNEYIQLSRLTPFEGENYPVNQTEAEKYYEPAVRLMVVSNFAGAKFSLELFTEQEYANRASEAATEARSVMAASLASFDERLLRCVRKIINILKPVTALEERWYENIVWTNFYPIKDLSGENNERCYSIQAEVAKKILIGQIEFHSPTHILFMAEGEGEFESFADVFSEVERVSGSKENRIIYKGRFGESKVLVINTAEKIKTKDDGERIAVKAVEAFKASEKYFFRRYKVTNCKNLEETLVLPENWGCSYAGRYAEGFVYRIMKKGTMQGEKFWECRILFHSSEDDVCYLTKLYDNIRLELIDPEHGASYVTGIEFTENEKIIKLRCAGEVFSNEDIEELSFNGVRIEKHEVFVTEEGTVDIGIKNSF